MLGSNLGNLISGYTVSLLLSSFVLIHFSNNISYMLMATFGGLILFLGYLVHFNISKNQENTISATHKDAKNDKITISQMLSSVFRSAPLIPALIADIGSTVCAILLPALAIYYYNNVIERPSLLAIHMLVVGICGVAGAYCARFILQKLNVRTSCLIIYPVISLALIATKLFAYDPAMFIVINGLLQLFISTTQPIESNLYFDIATYSEWKTGVKAHTFMLSMSYIPRKLSSILQSVVISITFISIGYKAGNTSQAMKDGIINAYSLVPAIFPLLGWIALFFFYKLTPEKVKQMRQEIEIRDKNL
jgi:Na+/melibiose symporter-like transporter